MIVDAFFLLGGCIRPSREIPGCIVSWVCSWDFGVYSQKLGRHWFIGALTCLLRHTSARDPKSHMAFPFLYLNHFIARAYLWCNLLLLLSPTLHECRKNACFPQFYFRMPPPVRTCSGQVGNLGSMYCEGRQLGVAGGEWGGEDRSEVVFPPVSNLSKGHQIQLLFPVPVESSRQICHCSLGSRWWLGGSGGWLLGPV